MRARSEMGCAWLVLEIFLIFEALKFGAWNFEAQETGCLKFSCTKNWLLEIFVHKKIGARDFEAPKPGAWVEAPSGASGALKHRNSVLQNNDNWSEPVRIIRAEVNFFKFEKIEIF